jgi:hypothetical protein
MRHISSSWAETAIRLYTLKLDSSSHGEEKDEEEKEKDFQCRALS